MSYKIFYMRCILITGIFIIIVYYLLDDPRTVKMILYQVYLFCINRSVRCAYTRIILDGVMWIN